MSATPQEPTPAIERQEMTVDIACVGFGPAMGGFLTTLSRSLLNADGSVRLERTTSPGLPPQGICYLRPGAGAKKPPLLHIQGCRPRAALTWLRVRAEA